MNNIYEDIYDYVDGHSCDESIAAMLRDVMKCQMKHQTTTKNYHYVTDLVNPMQAYWSKTRPEIIRPKELARKLALGKLLQTFANIWFRSFPDFFVEEGKIDGVWTGMPGVRGSIDYRVGESIIEFKTKPELPNNVENIFSKYPHDLEQLSFYSILHPSSPKVNYLVFMEDHHPNKLRSFRVVTKGPGLLKSIMLSRIKALDEAFLSKNPSNLGKCRYHGVGCEFQDSSCCPCDVTEVISTKLLAKAVDVVEDHEFNKKLEEFRQSAKVPKTMFTVRDIIAPRKHYMEYVSGINTIWIPDQTKEEYKACLWASIRLLPIKINQGDKSTVMDAQRDKRLRPHFMWSRIKSSGNPKGELIPYIFKVSDASKKSSLLSPFQYHLAELGIVCANHNVSKGMLFVIYPKLNKAVQVFQVNYKKDKLFGALKATLDSLDYAEEKKELHTLHSCPEFMNDGRKCPMFVDCHSKKDGGCT